MAGQVLNDETSTNDQDGSYTAILNKTVLSEVEEAKILLLLVLVLRLRLRMMHKCYSDFNEKNELCDISCELKVGA